MTRGILIVRTNPTSPEVEDEFNAWYDSTHVPEVVALPGVANGRRARLSEVQFRSAAHEFRYVAMYELDDVALASRSVADALAGGEHFHMSDTMHETRSSVIYEFIDE